MTSKRQVTIPKAITDLYGIREGDEVEFVPAGDAIRVVPAHPITEGLSIAERLRLFDEATRRQEERGGQWSKSMGDLEERGWTREELYEQ